MRRYIVDDVGTFLLQVYRTARECGPDAFQGAVLGLLRPHLGFVSAFWGAARLGGGDVVPTSLATMNIDPGFLPDWAREVPADPLIPYLTSMPGMALQVQVAREYAAAPALSAIAARYRMQSLTVISTPHSAHVPLQESLEWISLFRERPDDCCSESENRWLEQVMPHLAEAWRINRALHGQSSVDAGFAGLAIALADASNGTLLFADDAFRAVLAREWSGFDGQFAPPALRHRWADIRGRFTYTGRYSRIDGRCAGEVVYLSTQIRSGVDLLTRRQLEIAELYAQDLSNKEIAQHVGLSPATVRNHLAAAYAALGVRSKLQLAHRLTERRPGPI